MPYDFKGFKNVLEEKISWFKDELSSLRTGRATPALLDRVLVESYGARTPIAHIASISIDDAKTLGVTPWDTGLVTEIEKSIVSSNLGVSVNNDGRVIRVIFPELTNERREILKKALGDKLEEAKVSVRQAREEVWKDIQNKEKEGELSEDEKFRFKDEMQKIVDEYNDKLDGLADKKEKELSE